MSKKSDQVRAQLKDLKKGSKFERDGKKFEVLDKITLENGLIILKSSVVE